MRLFTLSGIWELFIPDLPEGERYKFEIRTTGGHLLKKSDPYGFAFEHPPQTASVVRTLSGYDWQDAAWMETRAPKTLAAIVEADRQSVVRFGRGSAMAQAYGHLILPLANERDKRTQVRWGMTDFERRFGRPAEGMWLPETAVCTATLRALLDAGIKFTILAPGQCAAVRRGSELKAVPTSDRALDTRRPYRVDVGDGRKIAVFFYDGATSQAVAFERLLANGDTFAHRLLSPFSKDSTTDDRGRM